MSATTPQDRIIEVCDGRLSMHVKVAGNGPPLVYLHPAGGPAWDPFLDALAAQHTVYAPEHPGMSAGAPDAIHAVDSYGELLLAYDEVLRALALDELTVIGQSYGGMIAADLAAHYPDRVARLVLLAPTGLWSQDAPVDMDRLLTATPEELPGLLFCDPTGPAAQAMFTMPDDPDAQIAAGVSLVWCLGCSAKFLWPIPDLGLRRRLHRVTARTLIVWGRQDALVPVAHAEEFGRLIDGAQVEILDSCGHIPQIEQGERTLGLVARFLDG